MLGRLFTTRRSEWLPGVALLGASAGISAALGLSLGITNVGIYVGIALTLLLGFGWLENRLARRKPEKPARAKAKLTLIHGGKGDYDLAQDETTDSQKYLM
jgi:hypothetical protein